MDGKKKTIILAVLALAPFVLSFDFSTSTTVNGNVTNCTRFDFLDIAMGIGAIVIGYATFKQHQPGGEDPHLGATGVVAAMFGIYHVISGFGLIGGCA